MDIAAKQALRQMIKLIRDISNLSKEEAYTLNSISANMQVSQIVNVQKVFTSCYQSQRFTPKNDYTADNHLATGFHISSLAELPTTIPTCPARGLCKVARGELEPGQ